MPQRHTIEVGITVNDDGSIQVQKFNEKLKETDEGLKDAESAASKFDKSFGEVVTGAYQRAGQMATEFLSSIPGQIVELGKLGIQSEAASLRFERFAGSTERADELLIAFQGATDGTIDKMGAMTSAGRLLQMGLVNTSDEMASVASIATKLGDQTLSATDRVADFSALLANQSTPRLDNFGISSGKVRARIIELQAATKGLSREQAFNTAVMEEGAKSLTRLGDTSDLASVKIAKITSALSDMKTEVGEELATSISETAGDVDALSNLIRAATPVVRLFTSEIIDQTLEYFGISQALKAFTQLQKKDVEVTDEHAAAIEGTSGTIDRFEQMLQHAITAVTNESDAISELSFVSQGLLSHLNAQIQSDAFLEQTIFGTIKAIEDEAKAIDNLSLATQDAELAQLNLSFSLSESSRRQMEEAESLADKKIEIEDKSAATIEDLRIRGQQKILKIDEDAETLKLLILEARLSESVEKQLEFNDETSEISRLRAQQTIEVLQAQVGEQRALLESSNDGMIVLAGENVDALIAEEERRKDESIRIINEQIEAQKEAARTKIATTAIDQLTEAYATADEETRAGILVAIQETSLQFGLADEASINLADRMLALNTKLVEGVIPAEGYNEALTGIIEANEAENLQLEKFGTLLTNMPTPIKETEEGIIALETAEIRAAESSRDARKAIDKQKEAQRKLANETLITTGKLDGFGESVEKLPSLKTVTIRVNYETSGSVPGGLPSNVPGFQSGGFAAGAAIVGEAGPELAFFPRGANIMNNANTRNVTNNNSFTQVNNSPSPSANQDFLFMQSMAQ